MDSVPSRDLAGCMAICFAILPDLELWTITGDAMLARFQRTDLPHAHHRTCCRNSTRGRGDPDRVCLGTSDLVRKLQRSRVKATEKTVSPLESGSRLSLVFQIVLLCGIHTDGGRTTTMNDEDDEHTQKDEKGTYDSSEQNYDKHVL